MNKQKVLVAAEIFSSNLGDYAIYDSMKSILLSKGVEVIPLDISGRNGWSNENSLSYKKNQSILGVAKSKILNNRMINRFLSLILWELILKRKIIKKWENLISNSDLVIIGGGQLITSSNANFFYKIKEIVLICQKLNKPFVFMGCGVGEKMNNLSIINYSMLLRKSNFISFRDSQSFNIFKPYLNDVDKKFVSPDFAFGFNSLSKKTQQEKILGINIISLSNFKKNNSSLSNLNDEAYLNFWLKVCQGAIEFGYKLKILTNGHVQDYNCAKHVYEYLKKNNVEIFLEPRPKKPEELYEQINSVDCIIATRMHAGIIAKALGKNTVTLIWDNKIPNVWKVIDMEKCTVDYRVLTSNTPWNVLINKLNSADQDKFNKESIVKDIERSLEIVLDIIR